MRMRRKKNLTTRLDSCSDIWIKHPEAQKGVWLTDAPQTELHLEIGCGKGSFTAQTALAHPNTRIIAIEREQNVLLLAMEKTKKLELSNILFIDGDARFLAEYFAPQEVSRIYLNFSDPWPGSRHAKRRLTAPGFLEIYQEILAEEGEIHIKTDNVPLFDYSLRTLEEAGFTLRERTRNLHEHGVQGVMTDYEAKFHNLGQPICRVVAIK